MKKYFTSVYIVFSILSMNFVQGCFYRPKSTLLNCSAQTYPPLQEIPVQLGNSRRIEFLDLSVNHIRELHDHTFKEYPNIRDLKLNENSIYSIEENAFSPLSQLQTLDLGTNALRSIPCNLPSSLLQLNLDKNIFTYESGDCFRCLSPLTSLETLSIRDSRLKIFPRMCQYAPNIMELDVSENSFDSISVEDLAPLCGLQSLKISPQRISQQDHLCQCLQFEIWLQDHNIQSNGNNSICNFDNTLDYSARKNCNLSPTKEAISVYDKCMEELKFRKYFPFIAIGGSILFVVLIFVILFVIWWYKRKRATKILKFENSSNMTAAYENHPLDDKNADAI